MTDNFQVFFISYQENNCEDNWLRTVSLYPLALRLHGIKGIHRAHLTCDQLSVTDYYWTVDGDNYITEQLIFEPEFDLHMFTALDPVFGDYTALGGVKLWKKGSLIINDMRHGDFCLNATKTKRVETQSFSRSDYNTTAFDAWKTAFRHCVKLSSPILQNRPNATKLDWYLNRWASSETLSSTNAKWCYQGYLDAQEYVSTCGDDRTLLHQINDYSFLKDYFNARKYTSV